MGHPAERVTSNPPLPRTQGWGNHSFRLYQKGGPAPAGLQAAGAADHLANGAWRCGKQTTFPTSPHPRRRLRTNVERGATLTFHLVQKIGPVIGLSGFSEAFIFSIFSAMGSFSIDQRSYSRALAFLALSAPANVRQPCSRWKETCCSSFGHFNQAACAWALASSLSILAATVSVSPSFINRCRSESAICLSL